MAWVFSVCGCLLCDKDHSETCGMNRQCKPVDRDGPEPLVARERPMAWKLLSPRLYSHHELSAHGGSVVCQVWF